MIKHTAIRYLPKEASVPNTIQKMNTVCRNPIKENSPKQNIFQAGG